MKRRNYSTAPRLHERIELFFASLIAYALDAAWVLLGLALLPIGAATKALSH